MLRRKPSCWRDRVPAGEYAALAGHGRRKAWRVGGPNASPWGDDIHPPTARFSRKQLPGVFQAPAPRRRCHFFPPALSLLLAVDCTARSVTFSKGRCGPTRILLRGINAAASQYRPATCETSKPQNTTNGARLCPPREDFSCSWPPCWPPAAARGRPPAPARPRAATPCRTCRTCRPTRPGRISPPPSRRRRRTPSSSTTSRSRRAELTVPIGAEVTWVNRDDVPHTATSTVKPRAFDSGALDTDQTYSHVFTTPGEYEYFCAVHPHMTGRVVVK